MNNGSHDHEHEHHDHSCERRKRKSDWNMTALALFVAVHFGTTIWWASRITAKQEFIIETVNELKSQLKANMDDRYRGADAARDFSIRDARIGQIEKRVERLESRR